MPKANPGTFEWIGFRKVLIYLHVDKLQPVSGQFVNGVLVQTRPPRAKWNHIVNDTDGQCPNGDTKVHYKFDAPFILKLLLTIFFCWYFQNEAVQCPADSTTWCTTSRIAFSCNVSAFMDAFILYIKHRDFRLTVPFFFKQMLSWCLNNKLIAPPAKFVQPKANAQCVYPIDQWCSSPAIAAQCDVVQYCVRVSYSSPPLSWPITCN